MSINIVIDQPDTESIMSTAIAAKNKALALEAFDAAFNQRDPAAAQRYWSPDYIQHSAHIQIGIHHEYSNRSEKQGLGAGGVRRRVQPARSGGGPALLVA